MSLSKIEDINSDVMCAEPQKEGGRIPKCTNTNLELDKKLTN